MSEKGKTKCRFMPTLKRRTRRQNSFNYYKILEFSAEGFPLHNLAEAIEE